MRVGVDIDGVLFPWDDVARQALQSKFGIHTRASTHWYDLRDTVDPKAWRWLWTREGQDYVFGTTGAVYMDAVIAVDTLLHLGHEVHFVTHRDPRRTLHHTADFLGRHFQTGPRWAGVHSVKNTTKKWNLGHWDVFIDDKPETALAMAEREAGMVFAPLRPWNRAELEGADGPHLHVYTDPMDIVTWVRERS